MTIAFVGHAIVSADGMIADADGYMPSALRNEVDWQRFQAALDSASLVVLGRKSHERFLNPGRPRLVVSRRVAAVGPDPADPRAAFWNPAGATLDYVLDGLGITEGTVAITGLFDLFLPRFTAFDLAEANRFLLPTGRPCFADAHPRAMLSEIGLKPVRFELIDTAEGVTLTRWEK